MTETTTPGYALILPPGFALIPAQGDVEADMRGCRTRLENMQFVGRPTYRSVEDVARVFKGGGVDGTAFVSVARNATLGSGGFVDNALLGAGRNLSQMSLTNNIVGLADSAVSWHDDFANGGILNVIPGLREFPGPVGDAIGNYGDWWTEVDRANFDVVGEWDPAGKS